MDDSNVQKPGEENENQQGSSRRDFLKNLGLAGVGVAAGAAALYSGHIFEAKKEVSGDEKVLLTQDGKLVSVDSLEIKAVEKTGTALHTQEGREGIAGRRWVMVTDLSKCRNARKCISACQGAHQLRPEQYHMNTLQMQDTPGTAPYNMPKNCQHCDNPPCVSVCPVDATYKRPDGIVLIDNERCIGCRFCMAACPYSARIFNWLEPRDAAAHAGEEYNVELNVPQKRGTISKCLFSADRLREGKLPYCVEACPNGVYYFGDENEDAVTNGTTKETVRLSKLLSDNGGYQLMPELGTKPRVYYLPPKNRLFPFEEARDETPEKV
ncbi:MAG TPA: 4Fe-4S dicluster domain-containing protein [Bacteroidales bacterium]|nr:4Fe-4S dicluster domain-containing protein [Bacteroidales bacterium]HPS63538.1 4Fe-4S dicluster domain-containing protein [Bacteroidales bacterium]